jgi:hypothetical protein
VLVINKSDINKSVINRKGGLYSGGGAYIWNEVSVSICGTWPFIRGGLYSGGLIFGGGVIVGGLRYIYSFTSIANQKSVRYSVSISYFTNIAIQNVNKVHTCAQEWTSSLNVWLEFLSKGTFNPPPPY